MLNKTIWSEVWRRVEERETIGLLLVTTNNWMARNKLLNCRPPSCKDFSVCCVKDPEVILIVRPDVPIEPEYKRHVARQLYSDLLPDEDTSPPDLD